MEDIDDAQFMEVETAAESNAATVRKVAKFPTLVPMENPYLSPRDEYYVRECYAEYYDLVMEVLSEKQGVTVTGTPGIGKSIFMGYFFDRFSCANPDMTIIMASYERDSTLKRAVVTKGRKRCGPVLYDRISMIKASEAANHPNMDEDDGEETRTEAVNGKAIWLLDGPPDIPPDAVRWVSFTSPNKEWLKKIATKKNVCTKVYMPVWTLKELREAADHLGRKDLTGDMTIDEERAYDTEEAHSLNVEQYYNLKESMAGKKVIDCRFAVFGGVPRMCFTAGYRDLRSDFTELVEAIGELSLGDISRAAREERRAQLVHRLLHYFVSPGDYWFPKVRVGSSFIRGGLVAREQVIVARNQQEFEDMARHNPAAKTLMGFFLESRTYREFHAGCTLQATKLGEEGGQNNLQIEVVQTPTVLGITNAFDIAGFDNSQPQLAIPDSTNLPSIDGLYWRPHGEQRPQVLLFQITVALVHPVKALGFYKALVAVGHWEAVVASPDNAALVFVVPEHNVPEFKAQSITDNPKLTGGSLVSMVHNIGKERTKQLNKLGIATVQQLQDFDASTLSEPYLGRVNLARRFLDDAEFVPEVCFNVLQRIPQFVWGL